MFDLSGFDHYQEEGLLRQCDVNVLREKLEDIIDRLYSNDHEIDNDEVDLSIRKMADILGVYVPKNTLEIKLGDYRFEFIEDKIKSFENLETIYFFYRTPKEAIEYLLMYSDKLVEIGLTEHDISDFCNSDFFKNRSNEFCYNIGHGIKNVF